MKAPSKNISASLRGQKEAGRSPIAPQKGSLKSANAVSMIVPGEGSVEAPPHKDMQNRSAAAYADAAGVVK
jgi:hypothetical protein